MSRRPAASPRPARIVRARRSLAAGAWALLAAFGAGCEPPAARVSRTADGGAAATSARDSAPDLRVDVSTPDRALRSRWRLQDLSRRVGVTMDSTVPGTRTWNAWHRAQRSLLTGEAEAAAEREEGAPQPVYQREILEVRQETASRAVILARVRNVSPIPANAVVGGFEAELRGTGELYRYVYEKDPGGWKLSQVYSRYPGESDWREYYDPRPVVPTWTYP